MHLASLACWLGGSLGAWLVYRQAQRDGAPPQKSLLWLARTFRVTHGALVLAVLAGVALMIEERLWPPADWLLWKLVLAGLFVVPLECANAFIAHAWLARDLAAGDPADTQRRIERWWTLAGPILALAAAAIGVLAVTKSAP